MRLRKYSFAFNLMIVAVVAAVFTIPGEAKQPGAGLIVVPQSSFGLFLDPHTPTELSGGIGSF